ncbi:MAG TPA: GatB/YqeY domain-containing protein [Patescibacteria group bacterium]|nr:GatB/YqeY domain-containing protein [Patescibacteria group bacterium]
MLRQEIERGIKEALKSGEALRLSALRLFLAAIQNEEIAKQEPLSDEEVMAIAQRLIKQRRESIAAFEKGGREELAAKERVELQVLSNFLPQQLSEDEIRKIVEEVRSNLPETDQNNFGKVMGMAMARLKGKAEGNTVSRVVKEVLG